MKPGCKQLIICFAAFGRAPGGDHGRDLVLALLLLGRVLTVGKLNLRRRFVHQSLKLVRRSSAKRCVDRQKPRSNHQDADRIATNRALEAWAHGI